MHLAFGYANFPSISISEWLSDWQSPNFMVIIYFCFEKVIIPNWMWKLSCIETFSGNSETINIALLIRFAPCARRGYMRIEFNAEFHRDSITPNLPCSVCVFAMESRKGIDVWKRILSISIVSIVALKCDVISFMCGYDICYFHFLSVCLCHFSFELKNAFTFSEKVAVHCELLPLSKHHIKFVHYSHTYTCIQLTEITTQ